MLELQGKYNTVKIFTDVIDEESIKQIFRLINNENFAHSTIRIMPDVHAGVGCVIGLSMTITDKVIPNLVGVDIGCGVMCIEIKEKEIEFSTLDEVIRNYVPAGFNIRGFRHKNSSKIDFDHVIAQYDRNRAELSIGSLGGGNHFISIEQDEEGTNYLLIHTGSRHFGTQVAKHYQNVAINQAKNRLNGTNEEKQQLIKQLKAQGREKEINAALKSISGKQTLSQEDKELAYLDGEDMQNYLHDMAIAQRFAYMNRKTIAEEIISHMGWKIENEFDTIHNYIDLNHMILRKGAISANKDELLIIPINMRDGSIIAKGKGNADWNQTAPHGAGRLYSRKKAKETFDLKAFQESMQGIYSTSIAESTLDECPMAYKDMTDIINNVQDTVSIMHYVKPIYNFKA